MDFEGVKGFVLAKLGRELDPAFYYHNLDHTVDVIRAARALNTMENTDPRSRLIIETAALFHDSGILNRYEGHEEESAKIARDVLPGYGYPEDEINEIANLILVTKEPDKAKTKEEMILCDADMDVLGREDFFISSFRLQLEWCVKGILTTTLREWFLLQVKFLEEHRFFTGSSRRLRQEQKLKNLAAIKELLE